MKIAKEVAEVITKKINDKFESKCKLIFEKVFFPFLIESKKRYTGLVWSKPNMYDKIEVRGIESIKRDSILLTREMMMTILKLIMIEKNVEKAI